MAAGCGQCGLAAGSGVWRADGRRRGAESGEEVAVEEVIEWLGALAAGDVFAVDVEALEDGLVEWSSDLVTRVAVELVRVLEELQVGIDELDCLDDASGSADVVIR